jgi:hypothetical protein
MEVKYKSPEEVAREMQMRQILLNSAKQKCAPFEAKIRASIGEKYPLGMTPADVANEIELNIEDGSLTAEMPNVNLSVVNDIEGTMIEGRVNELMDVLLLTASQAPNPHVAAKSLELYNQIENFQKIAPAKMRAEKETKEIEMLAEKELAVAMREEAREEAEEMQAAIKEDKEELQQAIKEDKEELQAAIKEDRENKKEAESKNKKQPLFELPHKHIKKALNMELDR